HLRAIAGAARQARREIRLSPQILTRHDLNRSTDVFPLMFLDIKDNHKLVLGEDIFSLLEIRRDHVRLACELMARTLVMRLHQFYLIRSNWRGSLLEELTDIVVPFARLLQHVLDLDGKPAPDDPQELLAAGAR